MIASVIPLSRSVGVKMAAAHGAFVASVVIAAFIADHHGIDFGYLSRDPNYLAGAPFYAGAFSNLGVLLWWAGGVVALTGGPEGETTVKRRDRGGRGPRQSQDGRPRSSRRWTRRGTVGCTDPTTVARRSRRPPRMRESSRARPILPK